MVRLSISVVELFTLIPQIKGDISTETRATHGPFKPADIDQKPQSTAGYCSTDPCLVVDMRIEDFRVSFLSYKLLCNLLLRADI